MEFGSDAWLLKSSNDDVDKCVAASTPITSSVDATVKAVTVVPADDNEERRRYVRYVWKLVMLLTSMLEFKMSVADI